MTRAPAQAAPALSAYTGARLAVRRHLSAQRLAEWAFGVEYARLDLPDRRAPGDRGFGFGMEHVLIERARVGCSIDGGRGGWETPVHWDADTVAACLIRLPPTHGGLRMALRVAELARAGLTPDWMPGAQPRFVPADWVENQHGRHPKTVIVSTEKTRHRGRVVRREYRMTPVVLHPDPARIARARDDWTEWRAALAWLQDALTRAPLRDHVVTNSLPPATPWRTE